MKSLTGSVVQTRSGDHNINWFHIFNRDTMLRMWTGFYIGISTLVYPSSNWGRWFSRLTQSRLTQLSSALRLGHQPGLGVHSKQPLLAS